MTVLSESRPTPVLGGLGLPGGTFPVLDTEKIYKGGILAVDSSGEAQMAANTQGLKVIGIANELIDNTADGEVLSQVLRGIFRFNNSATYALTRSSIGLPCYVEDDNIVAGFASAQISAGIVHDVDSTGVWVDMRPEALAMAWAMRPNTLVAKTDDYTITAAIAFDGRTVFRMSKSGGLTLTLVTAVPGMRFGVQRGSATATDDVTVQTAAADKIQGFDAISAAAKAVTNTTDAISDITWWRCNDALLWQLDNPIAIDIDKWPKNDA